MKPLSLLHSIGMPMLLASLLAGCATNQDAQHQVHHPDTAASQPSAPMSQGDSGGQMGMMDMQAMCEKHKKMMSATPEERQAMMDDRMKTMSPEMMQKHMQMMQEQCK